MTIPWKAAITKDYVAVPWETATGISTVVSWENAEVYAASWGAATGSTISPGIQVQNAPNPVSFSVYKSDINHVKVFVDVEYAIEGYVIFRSTKKTSGYTAIKTYHAGQYFYLNELIYESKINTQRDYYYQVLAFNTVDGKRVYSTPEKVYVVKGYTKKRINSKIKKLQKKFKSGRYWNHKGKKVKGSDSEITTKKPCKYHSSASDWDNSCNTYVCLAAGVVGKQCAGFAWLLSDKIFGETAFIKQHKSYNKAKVGDVIRYNDHSVLIIKKTKKYVKVAEANYDGHCRIKWGRKIKKSTLKKAKAVYSTRY